MSISRFLNDFNIVHSLPKSQNCCRKFLLTLIRWNLRFYCCWTKWKIQIINSIFKLPCFQYLIYIKWKGRVYVEWYKRLHTLSKTTHNIVPKSLTQFYMRIVLPVRCLYTEMSHATSKCTNTKCNASVSKCVKKDNKCVNSLNMFVHAI